MNRTIIIRTMLGLMSVLAVLVAGLLLFVKGEPSGGRADFAPFLKGELATFAMADEDLAAPEVTFVDGEGQEKSLADYRGKIILLNLWATWCAPCLNEMPTLDRLKAEMASDDFDVLAVSVDRAGVEKSREFLDRTGAQHLDLLVDAAMGFNFAFSAYQLPTTILLGRDGIEIGRVVGDTQWDAREVKLFLATIIEATAEDRSEDQNEEKSDQGSSGLSQ